MTLYTGKITPVLFRTGLLLIVALMAVLTPVDHIFAQDNGATPITLKLLGTYETGIYDEGAE